MTPLPDIDVLHPRDGVAVVECTGEHDLAGNDEVEALLAELVAANERIIVDVTNAEFIDSSFLRNLFQADQLAKQEGKRLVLQFGTAPIVRSALQHSGILQVLDHAPTREEALSLGLDSLAQREPGAHGDG